MVGVTHCSVFLHYLGSLFLMYPLSIPQTLNLNKEFKMSNRMKAIPGGKEEPYTGSQNNEDAIREFEMSQKTKLGIVKENTEERENELKKFRGMQRMKEISSLDLLVQAASGLEPLPMEFQWKNEASGIFSNKKTILGNAHILEKNGGIFRRCITGFVDNGRGDMAQILVDKDEETCSLEANLAAPIVSTKRGRAQSLPSRFRDSIVEPWKKGTKRSLEDHATQRSFSSVKTPRKHNGASPGSLNSAAEIDGIMGSDGKNSSSKTKYPFKEPGANVDNHERQINNMQNARICANREYD